MSFLALVVATFAICIVQAHVVVTLTPEQLTEEVQNLNHEMQIVKEQLASLKGPFDARVRTCPAGWLLFSSSCYGVSNEALSWPEALEVCERFGAGLVEVDNAAENEFIKGIGRSRGYQGTWLGATDIFSDGHWKWMSSGRTLSSGFTDWQPGQPANDGGPESCMTNWKTDGFDYRWGDLLCGLAMHFVCETRLN